DHHVPERTPRAEPRSNQNALRLTGGYDSVLGEVRWVPRGLRIEAQQHRHPLRRFVGGHGALKEPLQWRAPDRVDLEHERGGGDGRIGNELDVANYNAELIKYPCSCIVHYLIECHSLQIAAAWLA